jgi:hypothetical protein
MDLDPRALHAYLWISFFLKKVLVILRSLNDAHSLNVCPVLFVQSSPKVRTTFGIGWFPTLALRPSDIIRLSLLLYLSTSFVVVCRNVSFLPLYYIKIINLLLFFQKPHSFFLRPWQVCSVPRLFCALSKTRYIHLTKKIRTWNY